MTKIIATGSYLPKKILTNDDLAKIVNTSDEWINSRTGISQRHIAESGEYTSDLAYKSLADALTSYNLNANDLDGIIVATSTPDLIIPSTAALVHKKLQAKNCMFFDINVVCSGFTYALTMAHSLLQTSNFKRIAVIGAETFSRIINWEDRTTCVLFGDGAGTIILESTNNAESNVLGFELSGDSNYINALCTENSGVSHEKLGKLQMDGRTVFKVAVPKIIESVKKVCASTGISINDVDSFVLHQANDRILVAVAERLGIDKSKFVSTIAQHANTSGASIPLAFDYAVKHGAIKRGDLVMFCGFGAGFNWGSVLMKY